MDGITTDRRALLGALAAAPLAVAAPAAAVLPAPSTWAAVVANHDRCHRAVSTFDWKATAELSPPEFDALCNDLWAAQQAVILTPAPNWAAVEYKLGKVREWLRDTTVDDKLLAAIQTDVRRLAGREG